MIPVLLLSIITSIFACISIDANNKLSESISGFNGALDRTYDLYQSAYNLSSVITQGSAEMYTTGTDAAQGMLNIVSLADEITDTLIEIQSEYLELSSTLSNSQIVGEIQHFECDICDTLSEISERLSAEEVDEMQRTLVGFNERLDYMTASVTPTVEQIIDSVGVVANAGATLTRELDRRYKGVVDTIDWAKEVDETRNALVNAFMVLPLLCLIFVLSNIYFKKVGISSLNSILLWIVLITVWLDFAGHCTFVAILADACNEVDQIEMHAAVEFPDAVVQIGLACLGSINLADEYGISPYIEIVDGIMEDMPEVSQVETNDASNATYELENSIEDLDEEDFGFNETELIFVPIQEINGITSGHYTEENITEFDVSEYEVEDEEEENELRRLQTRAIDARDDRFIIVNLINELNVLINEIILEIETLYGTFNQLYEELIAAGLFLQPLWTAMKNFVDTTDCNSLFTDYFYLKQSTCQDMVNHGSDLLVWHLCIGILSIFTLIFSMATSTRLKNHQKEAVIVRAETGPNIVAVTPELNLHLSIGSVELGARGEQYSSNSLELSSGSPRRASGGAAVPEVHYSDSASDSNSYSSSSGIPTVG